MAPVVRWRVGMTAESSLYMGGAEHGPKVKVRTAGGRGGGGRGGGDRRSVPSRGGKATCHTVSLSLFFPRAQPLCTSSGGGVRRIWWAVFATNCSRHCVLPSAGVPSPAVSVTVPAARVPGVLGTVCRRSGMSVMFGSFASCAFGLGRALALVMVVAPLVAVPLVG